jgi:uncharacterized phage infection (PIP) family protein YhgE
MEHEEDGIPSPQTGSASGASRKDDTSSTRRRALRQGLRAAAAAAAGLLGGTGALAQQTTSGPPLVLRNEELAAQTRAFYKELKTNLELQNEFINNPAGLIARHFLPQSAVSSISAQRLSNANRVLYSMVSNDGFRNWAQNYQTNIDKTNKVDKQQIVKDFAAAIVRYGDAALVQGMMEESFMRARATGDWLVAVDAVVVAWAFGFIAFAVVLVVGARTGDAFTAAELRALTDKMIAKGRQLERTGELKKSFIQ